MPNCQINGTTKLWQSNDNSKKSAGFFYFTNIVSLIFVLVVTFIYVVLWELYENNKRVPLLDLTITVICPPGAIFRPFSSSFTSFVLRRGGAARAIWATPLSESPPLL